MTAESYLRELVDKNSLAVGAGSPGHKLTPRIVEIIKNWAGPNLLETYYSGSYQKGTAIRGEADLDLFISLSPETRGSISDLYWDLFRFLQNRSLNVKQQDVSIGLVYDGFHVDLIPARKQPGNTNDHAIYSTRRKSWTQTNVWKHIDDVRDSGRVREIKAIKIWKRCHNLDFPSFYLELSILRALTGMARDQIANNVWKVLKYFSDPFPSARIVDPSNSNNIVSDVLTSNEKLTIAKLAANSLTKGYWEEIVW